MTTRKFGISCGCVVKVEDAFAEIDYCKIHSGSASFPCGCTVVLEGSPVPGFEEMRVQTQTLKYCSKHRPDLLSMPAENLVAFTEAADKLVSDAHTNMGKVAAAGQKLIESMKNLKR